MFWLHVKAWLRRRKIAAGQVLVGAAPAARRELVPLHMHLTAADLLDWLCAKYSATYRIIRNADGTCLVLLTLADGYTVVSSGLATSTALAVAALHKKLESA